jgi:type VI secretion system secreted protein VgrG
MESDPIGLAGGSYSTYSYTNNNPVGAVDPLGLQTAPTLPIGPGPLIIPPVAIPGTPENQQFVNAALSAIEQIQAAARSAVQGNTSNCPNNDECNRLNQKVQNAKTRVGALGACRAGMTTAQLTERYYAWLDLAVARGTRDSKCFNGGDEGHQEAQSQAWLNVGSCGNLLGR